MSESKAWVEARAAWAVTHARCRAVGQKCLKCFDVWRKAGAKPGDVPPIFPSDHKGNCPDCGGKLSPSLPV